MAHQNPYGYEAPPPPVPPRPSQPPVSQPPYQNAPYFPPPPSAGDAQYQGYPPPVPANPGYNLDSGQYGSYATPYQPQMSGQPTPESSSGGGYHVDLRTQQYPGPPSTATAQQSVNNQAISYDRHGVYPPQNPPPLYQSYNPSSHTIAVPSQSTSYYQQPAPGQYAQHQPYQPASYQPATYQPATYQAATYQAVTYQHPTYEGQPAVTPQHHSAAPEQSQAPSESYYQPPPPPPPRPAGNLDMATNAPTPAPSAGVSTDPVANIASQLSNLAVRDVPPSAKPKLQPEPAPTIRATGPFNEVILECPEDSAVNYDIAWYHIPSIPDFLICSACHQKHIAPTKFVPLFEQIKMPVGTSSQCRFWVPRMADVLWPKAVASGDLADIKAFMAHRVCVRDCSGSAGVQAQAGVKWFSPEDGEPEGFIACEACLEDRIKGTAFEDRFVPTPLPQRAGETWACDICCGYLTRALKELGMKGKSDWAGMKSAMIKQTGLPACNGAVVPHNSRAWFTPRRPIPDMVICETCFKEKIAFTEFEDEFTRSEIPATTTNNSSSSSRGLSGFITALAGEDDQSETQSVCDMMQMSMLVALSAALSRHDFAVFWKAANTIIRAPKCSGDGIQGGTWYSIGKDGVEGFDVCTACHAGLVVPCGLGEFFAPAQRDVGETLLCDLNPAAPRMSTTIVKWGEALTVGVFEPFEAYVRKFANVPPCRGAAMLTNEVWYGFADAPICSECYVTFAEDTALDASISLRGVRDPRPTLCTLYSPRMRRLWMACCQLDPPSAKDFIDAAEQRAMIYTAVYTQMNAIQQMKLLKMRQAMHQGSLSIQYQGMAGIREVSGTTDGYLHGGNGLGWHSTWEGAESAKLFKNMQQGLANANNMDDTMRMIELERMWKEVE